MRARRVAILAALTGFAALSVLPTTAAAQPGTTVGQPLGWIFLSADNTTYDSDIRATTFTQFHVYLMVSTR